MKSTINPVEFICTHCPNHTYLDTERHCTWCNVSLHEKKYQAIWYLGDEQKAFKLYDYNTDYKMIMEITDSIDNITPQNLVNKIPILILFS